MTETFKKIADIIKVNTEPVYGFETDTERSEHSDEEEIVVDDDDNGGGEGDGSSDGNDNDKGGSDGESNDGSDDNKKGGGEGKNSDGNDSDKCDSDRESNGCSDDDNKKGGGGDKSSDGNDSDKGNSDGEDNNGSAGDGSGDGNDDSEKTLELTVAQQKKEIEEKKWVEKRAMNKAITRMNCLTSRLSHRFPKKTSQTSSLNCLQQMKSATLKMFPPKV